MLLLCIMNGTAQAKTGSILTKAIFSTDNTSAEKMALVDSNQDEKHTPKKLTTESSLPMKWHKWISTALNL